MKRIVKACTLKEGRRLYWIDIAKGISILCVILGHLGNPKLDFVYSFHLPVFFILSGYTMKQGVITKEFCKKKFSRLMVPYFITCTFVTVMHLFNLLLLTKDFSIHSFTETIYSGISQTFFASGGITNILGIEVGKGIGAIWFLPAMFFSVLVAQFIINKFSKTIIQLLLSIGLSALSAISASLLWFPFSIQAGIFALPFIVFGYCLKEKNILQKIKWYYYLLFLSVFIVGCFYNVAQPFWIVQCYMQDWFLTPLCAVCSSLFVIGCSRLITHFKILEFFGRNSLLFLCLHLLEMNTFRVWYIKFLPWISHIDAWWIAFCLEVFVVIILFFALQFILSSSKKRAKQNNSLGKRDRAIDILRFLLISLMLIGNSIYKSDGFSKFVYSFHMLAFMMVSGYFFKPSTCLKHSLKKLLKGLLPYIAFGVIYMLVTPGAFGSKLLTVFISISFSKKWFTSFSSVGPVYFITLLFGVKFIYIFVDRCKNEWAKILILSGLFIMGIMLGNSGYWLPWSMDCALFCLPFYHIAYYLRKYDALRILKEYSYLYFIFSCIWAYMIYTGAMELSCRAYGNLGVTFLGVLSAFAVVYLLCSYLAEKLLNFLVRFIAFLGESTVYILIVHTLFGHKISLFVETILSFNPINIFHLIVSIGIQFLLSILTAILVKGVKSICLNAKKKKTFKS